MKLCGAPLRRPSSHVVNLCPSLKSLLCFFFILIQVHISVYLKSKRCSAVSSVPWPVLHHQCTMLTIMREAHTITAHTSDTLSPGLSNNLKEPELTSLYVFQRQSVPLHLELSRGAELNQLLYILRNAVGSSEGAARRISSESKRDCILL